LPTVILYSIRKRISGLYYGWRMIGIVSALRVLGGGLHQYGLTVFFLPVTEELGLTRASTSLAFSLARAEGSLAAPLVGYLIDPYGPQPLMLAAALLGRPCHHHAAARDSCKNFWLALGGVSRRSAISHGRRTVVRWHTPFSGEHRHATGRRGDSPRNQGRCP
jgi:MFS family permease